MTEKVSGRVGDAEQALLAALPEPVPVSALPGDDPSREMERVRISIFWSDDAPDILTIDGEEVFGEFRQIVSYKAASIDLPRSVLRAALTQQEKANG